MLITEHCRLFAVPFIVALAVLLAGPTQAQDSAGDLTFVRLANGEPGGEGIYTINADGSDERPLFLFEDIGLPYDLDNGGYRCPVWSPDGTRLAINGTEGETNYLAVIDVASGDVQRVYEVEQGADAFHNIYFPEWVPDTNELSFGFLEAERTTGLILANGIQAVSLASGEVRTIRGDIGLTEDSYIGGPVPNYVPFAHSWSPDGSQVALVSYNWRTYIMDADGSNLRELPVQWIHGDVEWSLDASQLAISLYRMALVDPVTATENELVPIGETLNGNTVESLAWSPDGREIAYSTMSIDVGGGVFTTTFSVSVIDVATGAMRELVRTPTFAAGEYPYNISCVDWRPTEG